MKPKIDSLNIISNIGDIKTGWLPWMSSLAVKQGWDNRWLRITSENWKLELWQLFIMLGDMHDE